MLNSVASTGLVAEPSAAPAATDTSAPKSSGVTTQPSPTPTPSPTSISTAPTQQPTTTMTSTTTVVVSSSDQFSRVPGQQTVDLTGNLPGAGALAGDPVAVTTMTNEANNVLLAFFPTNDSTVLFSNQKLLQQVLIADGADPQFAAALASLAAQNPDALMGMLQAMGNGNYNVNFFVASQDGTNKQVTVQVSENFLPANLPQDAQGNAVIWAALVNKAYAKMLDQGLAGDANPLETLTGRQLTVLDTNNSNSAALWAALSLANPPLRVPVTVVTAPAERHPDSGLPPDHNLSVLNTFRGDNGEPMASLHKPGSLTLPGMNGDSHALFKVPLEQLEKAILLTVIADGHPAFDLINPGNPLDPANVANCCMHSRKARGSAEHGNDILRVFDSPTRLDDHRCLSCPFARHMCMP